MRGHMAAKMESPAQLSGLAVILDHPDIAADQLLLCSAAQVCSSWRAAVAASGAATTDAVIDNVSRHPQRQPSEYATTLLSKVGGFCTWLPKHATAVRSITVSCREGNLPASVTAACQMLALSLQAVGAGPKPLRLQRFSTSIASSELLAALPASLTELSLDSSAFEGGLAVAESVGAAVARCKQLQALSINSSKELYGLLEVQPLGGLSNLTRLHYVAQEFHTSDWEPLCTALHGLQDLQDLKLALTFISYDEHMAELRFRDLTALTRLDLALNKMPDGAGAWLAMPPNLQALSVALHPPLDDNETQPVPAMQLQGLRNLRRLTFNVLAQSLTQLQGTVEVLRQLTALEGLDLEYTSLQEAARDAQMWGSIPRLTGVSMWDDVLSQTNPNGVALQQQVIRSLSVLTQLTRLELTLLGTSYNPQKATPVCHDFSTLTGLRKLRLGHVGPNWLPSRDCLELMRLHQLTSLTLNDVSSAVDDAVAVALACNMPQLCHLDLTGAALSTDASMAALAQLRHLTRLVLTGNSVVKSDKRCVTRLQRYRHMAGLPELIVLQ